MKVSVVIPTFNSSSTLGRALQSIVEQDYSPLEVILVDDCSSEEEISRMKEIIRSFQPRLDVQFVLNTKKSNASATRNQGARLATGEWVAFLDSDDLMLPNKISEQVHFMEVNNADVSFHQIYRSELGSEYVEDNVFPKLDFDTETRVSDYLLADDGVIQTSSIMLKRCVLEKVQFNESLRRHQDFSFVLDLEHAGIPLFYLKRPLSHWVLEQGSNCLRKKGQNLDFSLFWLELYKDKLTPKAQFAYLSGTCLSFAKQEGRLGFYLQYLLKQFGLISPIQVVQCALKNKLNRDSNLL